MIDESVLCIPAERLAIAGLGTGFVSDDATIAAILLDPDHFAFVPRGDAERNPAFKQLIPYVVLRAGSRIFHYRRSAAGRESRLHSLRSIGVGGHISAEDATGGDPYRSGMLRELDEEVDLGGSIIAERRLGFVYDPRTAVGAVHLGVVHIVDLDAAAASPREAAIIDSGFAEPAELLADRDGFETWSQFALDAMAD